MISSLRGFVLFVGATSAIVEVGGVGFSVAVTPRFAATLRVGAEALVRTALVVREDDLSLYGFADTDDLSTFDLLRGVTGVGPKSAMGVLDALTPNQIASAIAAEDDGAFRKVSGIGPKTAKLIVLSLTGKIAVRASAGAAPARVDLSVSDSVLAALVGLGWSERLAAEALDETSRAASDSDLASVPALLRATLAQLGPRLGARS